MGLGLQGAYGVEALQQAIRQRIQDQIAEQQRRREYAQQQFENDLKTKTFNQNADIHRLTVQALLDRTAEAKQAADIGMAEKLSHGLTPNQNIDALAPANQGILEAVGRVKKGTAIPLGTPTMGLSADTLGSAPTPDAPSAPLISGQLRMNANPFGPAKTTKSYTGTEEQLAEQRHEQYVKSLPDGPLKQWLSAQIGTKPGSEKPPYQLITEPTGPPGTTTDANYLLNGRPIVAVRNKGRLTYQGQDITDNPNLRPYVAPKDTTGADNARLDRSYNYHSGLLQDAHKPIADRANRLDALTTSLDQHSAAADPLVAPELLTAMAGGIGSGLRMNEAEISRIVGGRTQWESLKAAANKWRAQGDPNAGLSITDVQRGQIRSLVAAVAAKTHQKADTINKARADLAAASNVNEHRKIFNDAQKQLDEFSLGGDAGPSPTGDAIQVGGFTVKVKKPGA